MVTNEVTQSGPPSFDWTPWGTGTLVPAVAPCAHLPSWGVQTSLGLSWFLNLPCWLRFWVLFGGGAGYLPPPSRKDAMRGPGWNIQGIPTHGLDTEWGSVERYRGIPTQSKDAGWGAGQENCPHNGKVRGSRAQLGKNRGIPGPRLKDAEVTPL